MPRHAHIPNARETHLPDTHAPRRPPAAQEERNYILRMVKKIKESGTNVLLIQKSILTDAVTELSLHYLVSVGASERVCGGGGGRGRVLHPTPPLSAHPPDHHPPQPHPPHTLPPLPQAKSKIMVVKDIEREDIEFISKTLGCLPIAHVDHMRPQKLGSAARVEDLEVRGGGWGGWVGGRVWVGGRERLPGVCRASTGRRGRMHPPVRAHHGQRRHPSTLPSTPHHNTLPPARWARGASCA